MTGTKYRIGVACLLGALALSAAVSHAKVFLRWKKSASDTEISRLGARLAYRTNAKINGGDAALEVFSWDEPFADAIRQLRSSCFPADKGDLIAGNGTAFGTLRDGYRVVRMLISRIDDRCIIFRIEQTETERLKSGRQKQHRLTSLPILEDSRPLFYVENGESGCRIEMSASRSEPAVAGAFFESSLSASGWRRLLAPKNSASHRQPLSTYVKGKELCCVFVSRRPGADITYVTVLLRPTKFAN